MPRVSLLVNGNVFECVGDPDFVREERNLFLTLFQHTQDQKLNVEEVPKLQPEVHGKATQVRREYDVPTILQMIREKEHLNINDSFVCELSDGRRITFIITDEEEEAYRFESRDCTGEYVTHDKVDEHFAKILALMPEELSAVIATTERKHIDRNGEVYAKFCKLFLPTASEIFPPNECEGDEGIYEQLEWYKDCHNRIRAKTEGNGTSGWYWTASRYTGNTTNWCRVNYAGHATHNNASATHIAAPVCFRILKS